jgi:GntR family transcriptional regulator/MocR family aminotransferase
MDLHITLVRGELTKQIYQQIRSAVLAGRIGAGQPLPSTRELAVQLEVSRNTVSAAYDRLVAEGFLTAHAGVRTYVSDHIAPSGRAAERVVAAGSRPRRVWDSQPEPVDMSVAELVFDFRPGVPDARMFPFATWRSLVGAELRDTAAGSAAYGDPAGHPGLRAAIARHVGVARGLVAAADDVLVTSGIQQAVDLICRVLVEPGDVVAVEEPGWPPPRVLFETAGARVVPVPVDAEGLVVDALPERARLVYVSPSHQFPLGVAMSLPRRVALLAWARRSGATIIEDDYDSEFRYTGRPLEPLQSLDDAGRVVYVGSFSKTLLPTLRLGFCIAPPSLFPALRKAKYVTDWHTVLPLQVALARFIDAGLFARHVRRMRRVYRERRDRILVNLATDDRLQPIASAAGLHITVRLDESADDQAVTARAWEAGVGVIPLSDFATRPVQPGLVLGYGVIPVGLIDAGLARLRDFLPRPPADAPSRGQAGRWDQSSGGTRIAG